MRYVLLVMAGLLARTAVAQATVNERANVALPHDSVSLVEVTYGPGGSSKPHHHPCPVIAYVVSGALRSRVGEAPESTYTTGQTFYEPSGAEHRVSANASKEKPVTFLAFFVCEKPR